jgi:hypothetical protein
MLKKNTNFLIPQNFVSLTLFFFEPPSVTQPFDKEARGRNSMGESGLRR